MSTFPLLISSPDGDLFRGDAEMLILRGTEGDLAIMAGHIPFVTAVVSGNCVIITAEWGTEGRHHRGRTPDC